MLLANDRALKLALLPLLGERVKEMLFLFVCLLPSLFSERGFRRQVVLHRTADCVVCVCEVWFFFLGFSSWLKGLIFFFFFPILYM